MQKRTKVIQVENPYNHKIIGEVEKTAMEDVPAFIETAEISFKNDKSQAIDRHNVLNWASILIEKEKEELARSICSETGKPIKESRIEVDRARTTMAWSAQEALRIDGIINPCDVTEHHLLKKAYVHRVPLGIVLAVTPFNFPLNIPAHKIGPALAAGNAVIIKPSPKSPLSTSRFVELINQAGLPGGLLQIVHGGAEVIQQLASGPVNAVSFTGSTDAGNELAKWAAGKKLTLELGGNDPAVVMDDADLDSAAHTIIGHRFSFSGQRCTSCKRVFIHQAVYEEMRHKLINRISKLIVGDPGNEDTDIGPLIDEKAAEKISRKIEAAVKNGAVLTAGGKKDGNFIYPALIENLKSDSPLLQEETFGPVLPIVKFNTFQEAVQLVNSTRYGLQSAIFTNKMDIIQKAFQEFEAGALIVNEGTGLRVESIPFGGVKASGIGREGIRYAINEFTTFKTLIM
jgi:acyl-CoA reductase-like NAD-dependent aldehyde dehydrogenase